MPGLRFKITTGILLLSLWAVNLYSQCTLSSVGSSTSSAGAASSSLTMSITTSSGSNRLMVVRASTYNSDPTSVTYNGINLTKLSTKNNGSQYASIWYLIAPPVGTFDLIISGSAGFIPRVNATRFTGANQTSPFGTPVSANFNGADPSLTVSSASGEIVIDVTSVNMSMTANSGQSSSYSVSSNGLYGTGSNKSGSASTVMSWDGVSPSGAHIAVAVKPCTPVIADAGADKQVCSGSSVSIGGSPTASGGTSPYTYAWSPATGLSASNVANPSASPTSTTTYTVVVTDNTGASDNDVVIVTVNPKPTASAGANKETCAGTGVGIGGSPTASGGTSPYTYAWSPSTGLSSTTTANPTASPTSTTTYTVTVTDNKGCTGTSSVIVTVNPKPTVSAGSNKEFCFGGSTSIGGSPTASGGTGPYTYAWSPTTGLNSTTISNPTASHTATTTYTVTVTDNKGCTNNAFVTVTVNQKPTVSAGSNQQVCPGGSATIGGSPTASGGTSPYTYNWSPSVTLNSATVANPVATPTATTVYTVLVTDNKGCTNSASVTVTINSSPVASAGVDKETCSGAGVSIGGSPTGSGGTSPYVYAWAPATALSSTTVANPTASPTATTVYTVTVTDNTGCTATDAVTVTVNPKPTVSAGSNQQICPGESNTIGGSPTASGGTSPYTYAWSPSTGLNSTTVSNPTASHTATTTYTVTVTDNKGCTNNAFVTVTVNQKPTVNAGTDKTICIDSTTTIGGSPTASGGTSPYIYAWSPSAGLSSTTVANPNANPTTTTTYTVLVTDSKGCTNSDAVVVTVDQSAVTLTASPGTNVCLTAGQPIVFTATPGNYGYYKFFKNNVAQQTSASNTYTLNAPATGDQVYVEVIDTSKVDTIINSCSGNISIGTTSVGSAGFLATSLTISHNTASGSNRMLLVRASTDDDDPASVTYNNIALTKLASSNRNNQRVSIWYLVNPPTGTYNVVVSGPQGFTPIVGVTSLTGVNQNTPFGSTASSNFSGSNPSVTISSATGELVVDVTNSTNNLTVGSGQTQQYNREEFVWVGTGSSEPGASSVTMSWSGSFPTGTILAARIKPASCPPDTQVVITGCAFGVSEIMTLTVNPMPTVNAGADKTICAGSTIVIGGTPTASDGTPPYNYIWIPSDGLNSATDSNPLASPTTTTTYTVGVEDSKGCFNSDQIVVTVNTVTVSITGETELFGNESTQLTVLTSSGNPSYSWSTGETSQSITVSPTITTTYTVTVTDLNNSCSASASVTVNVLPQYTAELSRKLDAGYVVTVGGKLNFMYEEEYEDADGLLTYTIFNNFNVAVAGSGDQNLSIVHGENRLTLNIATINGELPDGFYILEVINSKKEKFYLRFKHDTSAE